MNTQQLEQYILLRWQKHAHQAPPLSPLIDYQAEFPDNNSMNQQQALGKIRTIIRAHLPDPSYRLFLFGSRVAGYAKPYSDIDIGIVGPLTVPWRTITHIQEEMEESNIPYVVDVVDITTVDHSFRSLATKYARPI